MILTVREAKQSDENKWIDYISNNPGGTIYHHPLWLNIIESETGQKVIKLVCVDSSENIIGILPLQYTRGFPFGIGGIPGGKRLASLPRTPVGGPLTSDVKATRLLIQKAVNIVSEESDYLLQIKSFDPDINEKEKSLTKYFWREIYVKELPESPNEIRYGKSKNHAKIKWAVKKAGQNKVIRRIADKEEDLKNWYPLYLDTMRQHTTPARSYKFFLSLWEKLRPSKLMKLELAELEEGDVKAVIAGSVLLYFNKTVTHAFSGSSRIRKHIELRPNDLLHWYAMLDAQNNGFRYYDFGEVSKGNIGLATYKKKWDTTKFNMYHYYYPDPKILEEEDIDSGTTAGIKKKIWQGLPLGLTAKLGDVIYKRL